MTRRALAPLLGIGLLFCCGCPDGSYAIAPDPDPVITFTASPTAPEAGEPVVFTLTIDAAQLVTGTRVDFEGDGVWDTLRLYGSSSVLETLDHSYSSAGNRDAVAEVAFAGGRRESETARVTVTAGIPRIVEYALTAEASQTGGECYAVGDPYTFVGGSAPLGSSFTSSRQTLGTFARGDEAVFVQSFKQDAFGFNGIQFSYGCDFTARLYLGATALGVGTCSTTSLGIQTLDCTVNLRANIP